MHRGSVIFILLFLAACPPPEFKTLENVTLTCVTDDECPEGYYCETRIEPAECRPIVGRDADPLANPRR